MWRDGGGVKELKIHGGVRPIVLVDMDGVLADFNTSMWSAIRELTGVEYSRDLTGQSYDLRAVLPDRHKHLPDTVMSLPGFFRGLTPVPGGVAAVHAMEAAGFHVLLCSTPFVGSPSCASEKMAWVREHLGAQWVDRLILTADKTLVFGDVLIDDKPTIEGRVAPQWEHVAFGREPYSMAAPFARSFLESWEDWHDVIPSLVRDIHVT